MSDSAGGDDQAVCLRDVHPDRLARLLADLLWRQRPYLGRGTVHGAAGRRVGLPDRRQHPRSSSSAASSISSRSPSSSMPLLAPVAVKFGIDLIWFGVVLGVNMQTSFLTPPFGFALFYMRSVAPAPPGSTRSASARSPASRTAADLLGRGRLRHPAMHHDRGDPRLPAAVDRLRWAGGRSRSTIEIELPPTAAAKARASRSCRRCDLASRRIDPLPRSINRSERQQERAPRGALSLCGVTAGYSSFLRCRPIMKVS